MRLSDLHGSTVRAADGSTLGIVTDIRAVETADPGRLRVTALLVSRRHTGSLLGYDRRTEQGPLLVRWVVRRLHRDMRTIAWDDVASWDTSDRCIRLRPAVHQAPGHRQ